MITNLENTSGLTLWLWQPKGRLVAETRDQVFSIVNIVGPQCFRSVWFHVSNDHFILVMGSEEIILSTTTYEDCYL